MRQFQQSKAIIISWSATVSLLLGCFALPACAPAVTVTAPVSKITAAVADDLVCRTSDDNSVEDMPGTFKSFVQGGDGPQSIVVTFVGNWTKPTSGNPAGAFIFLEIDSNRVDVTSTNGGVLVHEGTATSVSNGTHGFTFVTEPIAPGTHVAKMRWADNVLSGSGTICVFERSLVIHHF
jgi:hypothetical protein